MPVIIFMLLLLTLTGCKEKLSVCEFDDVLVKKQETDKYLVGVGYKGIYVLRGSYPILGKVGRPGMLLGYKGVCEYPMLSLLEKYPDYQSPMVTKLAVDQAKRLKRHVPKIPSAAKPPMVDRGIKDEDQSPDCSRTRDSLQLDKQPSQETIARRACPD